MSAPENSDDISHELKGKIEYDLVKAANQEENVIPLKLDMDGSDTKAIPFTTSLASHEVGSDRVLSEDSGKNLKPSDIGQSIEIGSGEDHLSLVLKSSKVGADDPSGNNHNTKGSFNPELNTDQTLAEKGSTFLGTAISLGGEGHNRDSQDEDLVLKWEENVIPLKLDVDGSDTKAIPCTTSLASHEVGSDRVLSEDMDKNLKPSDIVQSIEIGSGDDNVNLVLESSKVGADNPSGNNHNTKGSFNPELNTDQTLAEKGSTFLGTALSLGGEDHNGDSQDEDLVLKWEENVIPLKLDVDGSDTKAIPCKTSLASHEVGSDRVLSEDMDKNLKPSDIVQSIEIGSGDDNVNLVLESSKVSADNPSGNNHNTKGSFNPELNTDQTLAKKGSTFLGTALSLGGEDHTDSQVEDLVLKWEENVIPLKLDVDGSDTKAIPCKTSLASHEVGSDRVLSEDMDKNLKPSNIGQSIEIGSGDDNLNLVLESSKVGADDLSGNNHNTKGLFDPELNTDQTLAEKGSTFLGTAISLAGEDHDRDNQDEDLVLKWDDDEEDISFVDTAIEETKNIEGTATTDENVLRKSEADILDCNQSEVKAILIKSPDKTILPAGTELVHSNKSEIIAILVDPPEKTICKGQSELVDSNQSKVEANSFEPPVETILISSKSSVPLKLECESNLIVLNKGFIIPNDAVKPSEVADSAIEHITSKPIVTAISDIIENQDEIEICKETIEKPDISFETGNKFDETMDIDKKEFESGFVTKKDTADPSITKESKEEVKTILKSEKSNKETEDAQENEQLLCEIDAQIAELDASLSQAENEKDSSKNPYGVMEKVNNSEHIVDKDKNLEKNVLPVKSDNSMKTNETVGAEAISKETGSTLSALHVENITSIAGNVMSADIAKSAMIHSDILMEQDISIDKSKTNEMDIDIGENTVNVFDNSAISVMGDTPYEDKKDFDATISDNLSINAEDVANSTTILNISIADANIESTSIINDKIVTQDTSTIIKPIQHGLNEPNMMLEIPTQELIDIDESLNLTESETMIVDDNNSVSNEKDVVGNQPDSRASCVIDTVCKDNVNTENVLGSDVNTVDEVSDAVASLINTEPIGSTEVNTEVDKSLTEKESVALKISTNKNVDNQSQCPEEANTLILPAVSLTETVQKPKNEDEVDNKLVKEQNFDLEAIVAENSIVENIAPLENQLLKPDKVAVDKSALVENTGNSITEQAVEGDQMQQDNKLDSVELDAQPSTSKEPDVQPSTSTWMAPDSSDEEVTDSLGLLAECSRVADDDDEQETSDHDDDEEDFDADDADESSNQLGPDLSGDSGPQSETDASKTTQESDSQGFEKAVQSKTDLFDLLLDDKEKPSGELELSALAAEELKGDADMDVDEDIVCEEMEVTPNILIGDADPAVDAALDATLDAALDDTLQIRDKTPEAPADQQTQLEAAVSTENKMDDSQDSSQSRSKLRTILMEKQLESVAEESKTPSSSKKEIARAETIVDLGESSSEEDIQEVKKTLSNSTEVKETTTAKITSRINTNEISIKTTSGPKPPLAILEAKVNESQAPAKPKYGALEVFNIDSDDEDPPPAVPAENEKGVNKCINSLCASGGLAPYVAADSSARMFYQNKRRGYVCLPCLQPVHHMTEKLVEGVKKFTPLLELEVRERDQECVEISDSDSEDEADSVSHGDREKIIEPAILERHLADIINATWNKYKFEQLLKDAQGQFYEEIGRIEQESKEVNEMLDECQSATDRLRNELYASFAVERRAQPPLTIFDTPDSQFACLETQSEIIKDAASRKRRMSESSESIAKKPIPVRHTSTPIPAGHTSTQGDTESQKQPDSSKLDDDKDVSVVRLTAETPPACLPPPGEPARPPLCAGAAVMAMRHAFGSWIRARVLDVTPKGSTSASQHFTTCRVKFENKTNRATKILPARCLAYPTPSEVRMTIGTRVIALFKAMSSDDKEPKRESYYSGIIAEIPNPVNKYRYLVFFDDGYAQYVQHADTRLVCEFSSLVWEEVHSFSREFVKEYLLAYPERPMVRLHTGQNLKTEWNGKWWVSRVIAVDASLVQVYFEQDKRTEWIYRGSTRLAPLYLELQAAEKHRLRPLPRNRQNKLNMPYVEYTRTDEAEAKGADTQLTSPKADQEEMRRQRAVAKKSTGPAPPPALHPAPPPAIPDTVTSRVVYYTPKNAVKPLTMVPHSCGPRCRRTDVLPLKDLRTYNPLAKPLLSGWERQIARCKGHKEVAYRAPCGRRIRNMKELHRYLRMINSDMGVDLFDFGPTTHCLAEFVLNKCIVGKKDLSHGKENVPVPCVNYYDDSLPEFCSYNTERTPTAGVPLNLDPDFLCGCDCTDDCEDKSKCACWKLTLEGAHTIGFEGDNVGYEYKRLLEPLPSGIYECNVRCKCKSTCLNRVAQHPLQLKLQVFKTANRGWGIRALNDVPKGSFLCIYAGNLLTDATANLDGLNEGDEYLAELDYIEVVEQMKEGYEDDIPDDDKKLDKKELGKRSESESEPTESEEEESGSKSDEADGDFEPAYIPGVFGEFSKRLRKRDKKKKKEEEVKKDKEGKENAEEDCITISDDEEIREPSRFAAQAGMGEKYISKYRSVRSYFGRDEACYIMDAKVQGNIGRYLNHSCSPNVFVQNVFVDTHDPRFPWVAFFALAHIRAGTELTWNYNYDVGSVPGKALYCYCGAANCRGRLL